MSTEALIFWGFAAFVALLLAAGAVQHWLTPKQPAPDQPKPETHNCDLCRTYRARTLATDHDLKPVRVCFGCLDEGFVRGWWATDTTGAAS